MNNEKKEKQQPFFKLKETRRRYNIKQTDFALLLGITSSAYGNKENGRGTFTFEEIVLILWALNKKAIHHQHETLTFEDVFQKYEYDVQIKDFKMLDFKDRYKIWFDDLAEYAKLWEIRRLLGIDYFNKDYKYSKK